MVAGTDIGLTCGGFGIGLRRPYRDDFCYPAAITLDAQRQNLEAEKAYLKNRLDFITKALDNIIKDENGENQTSE